jgi:hypothetical protein
MDLWVMLSHLMTTMDFFFLTNTYSYEDVWIALAKALRSRVRADPSPMKSALTNTLPDPCRRL